MPPYVMYFSYRMKWQGADFRFSPGAEGFSVPHALQTSPEAERTSIQFAPEALSWGEEREGKGKRSNAHMYKYKSCVTGLEPETLCLTLISTCLALLFHWLFWNNEIEKKEFPKSRHYAASRKVAGSIPDEVIEFFFYLSNPTSFSMALGFTQPLIEMSTRNRKKNISAE
jgi:hypothetical protein